MNKFKIATYSLIAANIGIYLWMVSAGVSPIAPSGEELFNWGGSSSQSLASGQWWRLITCMFVHSGPIHLLLNMYALYMIGPLLEFTLGKKRLLFAYFSTGILASLASCLFHANSPPDKLHVADARSVRLLGLPVDDGLFAAEFEAW